MGVVHKKHQVQRNVYDLAIERLGICFDEYDRVVVSFSGGKDSTACLNLALQVARAKNRLPLDVFFYDEEAIPPETVEYMERIAKNPEIRLQWLCVPLKHRNACSRRSPWWNPWAIEDQAKWCRPFPELGIYDERYRNRATPDCEGIVCPPNWGRVCLVLGIRTQESLNRYMAIAGNKTGYRAFISGGKVAWTMRAYPIYDWTHEDVWLAPELYGWDYNRAYDVMAAAGVSVGHQRCSPPFGEQPLERLWTYKVCWPELWAKMHDRVPGASTAARYARTALYGYGGSHDAKPDEMSWKDFILLKVQQFGPKDRKACAESVKRMIEFHESKSSRPIPDTEPDPDSGLCWQDIAPVAIRGDLKGPRTAIRVMAKAHYRTKDKFSNKESGGSDAGA